jgi:hypothetical protein
MGDYFNLAFSGCFFRSEISDYLKEKWQRSFLSLFTIVVKQISENDVKQSEGIRTNSDRKYDQQ